MTQVITNKHFKNYIGSSLVKRRLPSEHERFERFIPQNSKYEIIDFMPSSWVKNILFNRWKEINVVAFMGLVTITNGFECSLEKLQVKGDPRRSSIHPFDAGVQAIMTQETPDYIQDTDKYTQLILSMEPFSI